MAWGAWSHSDDVISLEMYLDEGAKTRDVCVEVVEGWLLVRIDASQAPPARDRRRSRVEHPRREWNARRFPLYRGMFAAKPDLDIALRRKGARRL